MQLLFERKKFISNKTYTDRVNISYPNHFTLPVCLICDQIVIRNRSAHMPFISTCDVESKVPRQRAFSMLDVSIQECLLRGNFSSIHIL